MSTATWDQLSIFSFPPKKIQGQSTDRSFQAAIPGTRLFTMYSFYFAFIAFPFYLRIKHY